jgi:2-methylisocitrate lyase-like PEP mutase family enzyme
MDKADDFRALHHGPPILVLPNAWDAASARVFAAAGFKAVATTSAGVAAALGYPDGGMVPPHEMIEAIGRIVRSVDVPVTADIEHAYGETPDAVADMVLRVIATGAVGVNVEDHVPGEADLEPAMLQVDKIKAIVRAASNAGVRVVVNARTDVFLRRIGEESARLEAAIARGAMYLAAGADCVFVPGVVDAPTIRALVEGIRGPINVLAVDGTPNVESRLGSDAGVARRRASDRRGDPHARHVYVHARSCPVRGAQRSDAPLKPAPARPSASAVSPGFRSMRLTGRLREPFAPPARPDRPSTRRRGRSRRRPGDSD